MAKKPKKRTAKKKTTRRRPVKRTVKKNGPLKWLKKKRLAAAKKKRMAEMLKGNPGKMRTVKGSTGWMKATAVRFVKKPGKPMQVLIRRKKSKR